MTVFQRLLFSLLYCAPLMAFAQYVQQEVNYRIIATLIDSQDRIEADMELDYHNNAPYALDRIYIHLWPNAYAKKNTAFAEQQLQMGNLDFHFADPSAMGAINDLAFQVNGKTLTWHFDPKHIDIAIVYLPNSLETGESITISTPFTVQVPESFSRLGRTARGYQITQWYPKPAVLDENGWHPMPYLNQGEFYSEFGSYQVTLDVPAGMIVAATGTLVNEEARSFRESLVNRPLDIQDKIREQQKGRRTWEFKADSVHDFVWFADPTLGIRCDTAVLDNGRKVACWAYYPSWYDNLWQHATGYLARSVRFYSRNVGEYPYDNVSAVQSTFSKGVNMEYPMITLIGPALDTSSLDAVITHEVGHNWFYGILGSNERRYPWMDEGVNSYYEERYKREYYSGNQGNFNPDYMRKPAILSDPQLLLSYHDRIDHLQASGLSSEEYTGINYYLSIYNRPDLAYAKLADYMSLSVFDKAMQRYFREWKFRHPSPDDLQAILEGECQCDLNWFFESLLLHDQMPDFRLSRLERDSLRILRLQGTAVPVKLTVTNGNTALLEQWLYFTGQDTVIENPPLLSGLISLDEDYYRADPTPWNNRLRTDKPAILTRALSLRFSPRVDDGFATAIHTMPAFGWNAYDGLMAGGAFFSPLIYPRRFQFGFVPMFSFQQKTLSGMCEIRWEKPFIQGRVKRLEIGLRTRRFHFNDNDVYGFTDRYTKLEPSVELLFRPASVHSAVSQRFTYRYSQIWLTYGQGVNIDSLIFRTRKKSYGIHQLVYQLENDHVLHPFDARIEAEAGKGFIRLGLTVEQVFPYNAKGHAVRFRLFGGILPLLKDPPANVSLQFSGKPGGESNPTDYAFREWMFARNEQSGINSQQIWIKDAGLKTLSTVGVSNDWMLGFGADVRLPLPVPIHAYADMALYPAFFESGVQFSYSGGFSVILVRDIIEIFVPVLESQDILDSVTYEQRNRFFERISFLFDISKLNAFDQARQALDSS